MRKPPRSSVERGERVLAWAAVAGAEDPSAVVIASDRALYLPREAGGPDATRLPWQVIRQAAWEDPFLVVEAPDADAMRTLRVPLVEPRRIPEVVRERVMATIVITERIQLTDDAGATAVCRREPGSDQVTWTVALDPGLDPADPVLQAAAHEALEALRTTLGV